MSELIKLPAGHDRKKYLGGSDVAAIFGVSRFKTPYDLWLDKTRSPSEPEPQLDPAKKKFFRRRKAQEPIIKGMLEEEYGMEVTRLSIDEDPNRYLDADHPFLACEIDFEFRMNDSMREHFADRDDFAAIANGTILNGEIKTVHPFAAGEWGEQGSEEVPIYYAAQVMHGLGITKKPAAIVAALFGLDVLVCFPIMADQETIDAMREKAIHFWNYNVLGNNPPELVSTEDVKKAYYSYAGKPVALSAEAFQALNDLEAIRGRMQALEGDKIECEWKVARCVAFNWGSDVIDRSEKKGQVKVDVTSTEDAVLEYDGAEVGSWKRQRGSFLDQKRLKIEHPEIVESYNVSHLYRVLRMKKAKK